MWHLNTFGHLNLWVWVEFYKTCMSNRLFTNQYLIFFFQHRVSTILDSDTILVLSDGHIAEFDTPDNLLLREDSIFASLVKAGLWERDSCILLVNKLNNHEILIFPTTNYENINSFVMSWIITQLFSNSYKMLHLFILYVTYYFLHSL